jgi:hypothetical protein
VGTVNILFLPNCAIDGSTIVLVLAVLEVVVLLLVHWKDTDSWRFGLVSSGIMRKTLTKKEFGIHE